MSSCAAPERFRAALLDQIEHYLQQLREELKDEDRSEFRLDVRGYIVVLEAGDNGRDLGNIGLNSEDGRLLGSCPEYVAVLYDNDYLMTFFTQIRAYDEEVEQWLRDQAERS